MSTKETLLGTQHRSVHWAVVDRLASKPSADSNAREIQFGEWQKLLGWEIAAAAPQVFTRAIEHIVHLALSGKADVVQTVRVLSDLVVVPETQRCRVSETLVLSSASQALVRLVVSGADSLVYAQGSSARDNIMRRAVETNPDVWQYVLLHLREALCSNERAFSEVWQGCSRFLVFAVIDPSVPSWAQVQAIQTVFELVALQTQRPEEALAVLEWAIDLGVRIPVTVYNNPELSGRWCRLRWIVECCQSILVLSPSAPDEVATRLLGCTSNVRLILASLAYSEALSKFSSQQPALPRTHQDDTTVSLWLIRITRTAYALQQQATTADAQYRELVDMVVWTTAASQIARSAALLGQKNWLELLEMTVRNKQVFSGVPRQVRALARFPLLCVAMDGFTPDVCSRALSLSVDIDQTASASELRDPGGFGKLQTQLTVMSTSGWVSGRLALLFQNLVDYLEVAGWVGCHTPGAGSRDKPLNTMANAMSPISDRPLLLAPFMFDWTETSSVVPRLALAKLVALLATYPSMRLNLLPLLMGVLRHPEAPAKLRHAIILDALPCLASTHDAYATSRVVSIISGMWGQAGKQGSMQRTGRCDTGSIRLRCLAVRAWYKTVQHNPRVWRDLKPVFVQWVESKKAAQLSRKAGSALEPEYEWTVLVTMRDLVQYEPDRYADQVLPFVYSLLSYALPSLSASSTALLIDIANVCVEANVAGVRSVWAAIVKKAAELWTARIGKGHAQTVLVLMSLAKFFALVATHGEDTETYAAFRQEILADFVEPLCGLPKQHEASEDVGSDTKEAASTTLLLEPRARDLFLSALSKYPLEEVLPLLSGSTTNQAVHRIVVSLVQQLQEQDDLSIGKLMDRISRSGSCADLLACLMDNEVRFMRRSHITGSSAQGKTSTEDDENEAADQGQRRSWTRSNFERSQWLNDVLLPALAKVCSEYWDGPAADQLDQVTGYAMAAMMGPSVTDGADGPEQAEDLPASAVIDRFAAQLTSLIVDIPLADHWCVRNSAADSWSIWFTNAFAAIQADLASMGAGADHSAVSTSDRASAISLASSQFFNTVSDSLRASHVPAHQANAIFACVGLVKTVAGVDTTQGSVLAVAVSELLNSTRTLPFITASPEEFWVESAGSRNEEVLAAAIECVGQIARPNSDDTRMLNRTARFLMSALTLQAEKKCRIAASVLHSIGRSMIFLHSTLDSRKAGGGNSESDTDDGIVVESDDLRRCVERLGIFQPAGDSGAGPVVDLGNIGLAMSLATMHRHWIARLINPALAEQNQLPRASQAERLVSQTLRTAFDSVRQVESGRWSQAALTSLFYLCFVWPPKPITPRHMELHGSLFAVTPDRVWLTVTRLLRKLWSSGDDGSGKKQSTTRDLDLINQVELAYAALTYHLVMTGGQGAAHATHARLVRQFSETIEGDFGDLELAATEKPSLRANRTVSLAILLGIPMHGVPETTVSNEYLPLAQQNNLPVLLGVGSVQYGSTAWLRLPEQTLQKPLGSLVACSGLLRYLKNDGDDADTANDAGQNSFVSKIAREEIDDVRAARIAGVCLSALWAQSRRSMHLLIAEQQDSELVGADNSTGTGESAQRAAVTSEFVETATAEEEPQSLSRLPAPTSWCRAFWECLCTLAGSLEDKESGMIVDSVECKLAYLLRSMLQMARPFPLVDFNGVFTRVLQVYMASDRIGSSANAPLPVLWLLVRVASRFSATSYSMTLFLTKAVQSIVGRAVDIALGSPASDQYLDKIGSNSLLALAIACVGDTGLGRLLQLSGFVATSSAAIGDDLLARRALAAKLKSSVIPREVASAVCTDEVCVSQELASIVNRTQTGGDSQGHSLNGTETEAERMFRLLSKVVIPAQKTANVCVGLMSRLQLSAKQGVTIGSPQIFAYQIFILDTFAEYIPTAGNKSSGPQQGMVVLDAARQRIVGDLLQVLGATKQIRHGRELAAMSRRIISATFSGRDSAERALGQPMDQLDTDGFCEAVEQQALILGHQLATSAAVHERRRMVGDWLKRLVREWAQRGSGTGRMAVNSAVAWGLRNVASQIHSCESEHAGIARHYVIQALDVLILAGSIVRSGSHDTAASDWIASLLSVSWLLPILAGVSLAHPEGVTEVQACAALAGIASDEMLGFVGARGSGSGTDRGASIGDAKAVFAEQLRSRMVGLQELVGAPVLQRHVRLALSDLAVLGYLPDVLFSLFV